MNQGVVIAVRGSVVDAEFAGQIPELRSQLRAGADGSVVVEVAVHLDAHRVRGVALISTRGLFRGTPVIHTGGSLQIPVGDAVLFGTDHSYHSTQRDYFSPGYKYHDTAALAPSEILPRSGLLEQSVLTGASDLSGSAFIAAHNCGIEMIATQATP